MKTKRSFVLVAGRLDLCLSARSRTLLFLDLGGQALAVRENLWEYNEEDERKPRSQKEIALLW